jgi:dipeptidase E
MKLLLTSAGITNQSIANELARLASKDLSQIKIGFIPTAANVEEGSKDWFINQLTNLIQYGFNWIDIVDISSPGFDWKKRLAEVDVILVSGGNTFHLLDQVRKTGFDIWLKENLGKKVYVGISAGSIIVTPTIAIASIDNGDINIPGIEDLSGLSLVRFEVSPHTPENVSHEANKIYLKTIRNDLYALDNNSALSVEKTSLKVISEGEWIKY